MRDMHLHCHRGSRRHSRNGCLLDVDSISAKGRRGAKQPGKAMLIQETGLQRELTPDEIARRTPEQEASLFERKFALSFVYGSGAIEWLWNSNSYMTESNETPIGALHADGTEKPEATVLRDMAKFAAAASPHLRNPKLPDVAIVTSQVAQFSVHPELQLAAQQNAVRALAYDLGQPCYIIAENQIDNLGSPKLVLLPSAQALRESTWQALLSYAKNGGNLLVTGPVSRDEHWRLVDRLTPLGLKASTEPLTFHSSGFYADRKSGRVSPAIPFDQQKQQLLEFLRFEDGSAEAALSLGKGKLWWYAYPVELSDNLEAAAFTYARALGLSDRRFEARPGTLIYPIELEDAVLFIFESEFSQDQEINIRDEVTGTELKFKLPSERAALALISKKTKQIVAKYGF